MAKPVLIIKLFDVLEAEDVEQAIKVVAKACPDYNVFAIDGNTNVQFEVGNGEPAKAVDISVEELKELANGLEHSVK